MYPTSTPRAETPSMPRRAARKIRSTWPRFLVIILYLHSREIAGLLQHRSVDLFRFHPVRREFGRRSLLKRADDLRRHQDDELGLAVLVPRAPEEGSEDGDVAQERNLGDLLGDLVVDQARQGEGLPVRELEAGLRFA